MGLLAFAALSELGSYHVKYISRRKAGSIKSLGSSRLATGVRIRIENSGHQQIAIPCDSCLAARRHESNYLDHPVKHSILSLSVVVT